MGFEWSCDRVWKWERVVGRLAHVLDADAPVGAETLQHKLQQGRVVAILDHCGRTR